MGERTDPLDDQLDRYDQRPYDADSYGAKRDERAAGDIDIDKDVDTNDDPGQIRGDIEDTRSQMSHTIDEIQERLSPQRLMNEAKDTVREATIGKAEQMVSDATDTARSAGQGIMATIRENPLPAALAGIGLGWLIYKSREHVSNKQSYTTGYGARTLSYPQQGPSVKVRMQDTASQVTDQAQQVASQAGDKVQQAASQLQDSASQIADQAQYQAQRARSWLERSWDENPLPLGALALTAGAVIGLSLPATQAENQLMGSTRDNLMQKAQDTAQDTVQKVQAVAQEATDAAKDAAQQEASNQGLTQPK